MKMEFSFSAIMIFTLFEDNNGTLGLVTSPRKTPRTRHISVKYHLFREHYGEVKGITIRNILLYKEVTHGTVIVIIRNKQVREKRTK